MTGENAINTVMSAFLGTATSLYAADKAISERLGSLIFVSLIVCLLGSIIAGVSINIIANCWHNLRIHRESDKTRLDNMTRFVKHLFIFLFINALFVLFSGLQYKQYIANLFDIYGFIICSSLFIWLLSLTALTHLGAKAYHDQATQAD